MTQRPVFDHSAEPNRSRMPEWVRQSLASGHYAKTHQTIHTQRLHTVCEEARCPNRGECWSRGTATIMLLGDVCTRACAFCAVKTGRPNGVDSDEPERVAAAIQAMQLDYVVLTSVNRDDLADGGAQIFADTITALRRRMSHLGIELLTPDFYRVQAQAIALMLHALRHASGAQRLVWGHNVETIPRLYQRVRKGADYQRSLTLLEQIAAHAEFETKSAIMCGLGEQEHEVQAVLQDLYRVGVKRVALGQYLRPTRYHLPVLEYVAPAQFERYAAIARDIGFSWVKAGPMVRSSYHAEE